MAGGSVHRNITLVALTALFTLLPAATAAANEAPECWGGELYAEAGVPLRLVPYCHDADGDELSYALAEQPQHGEITGPYEETFEYGGSYRYYLYTADKSYSGLDSFSYTANDGQLDSAPARVTITVEPYHNDPPECYGGGKYHIRHGGSIELYLGCWDDEGDPLSFSFTQLPKHGSASEPADGRTTYTHDGTRSRRDGFSLAVSDGVNDSVPLRYRLVIHRRLVSADVDGPGGQHGELRVDNQGDIRACKESDSPYDLNGQIEVTPSQAPYPLWWAGYGGCYPAPYE